MTPQEPTSAHTLRITGWPVASAMLAVVACFAATLLFSQLELRPISDHAIDILGDAAPSLEHLAAIQTQLMRWTPQVYEHIDGADRDTNHTRATLADIRNSIDSEIALYRMLPSFPGESQLMDQVVADLALLDEVTAQVLADADAGAPQLARQRMRDHFHPRMARTNVDVTAIRTLNARFIRVRAASILETRHTAQRVVAVLGALSLLVATLATILVLRSLRSRARLLEERDRLLGARADELEAFAGRVAHDLRNPLAAIAMRVMTAQEQSDASPVIRDHLSKLARQVERTSGIIDGMLEFARAGANPAPGSHADLRAVIDELMPEVRPAAEAANAELEVEPFPPIELACAPEALASVLANLVSNAVKYVVDGQQVPRRILIRVAERDGRGHVEVTDNGPGFPANAQNTVFQPFRRLDHRHPGIGLGLATVKKIIEAYHGRVGLRSTPGEGSSFWFELPKAA